MKSNLKIKLIILSIILLLVFSIVLYIIYPRPQSEVEDTEEIEEAQCPKNHVCMHQKTFNQVINQNVNTTKPRYIEDTAISRDKKVLNDPLFPPLGRTDRMTFDSVAYETRQRNINIPTKDIGDTFRLVGYVTSQEGERDAGGNNWKLMARQKDRNESEFYMIPTNNNYDIKVPLTPDVCTGPRLRDIYDIPNQLTFKSPLLNIGSYDFVELPRTQFTDNYYL